jgi:hypothetical protein
MDRRLAGRLFEQKYRHRQMDVVLVVDGVSEEL